ncbi:hypothetical protein JCM8208_006328 [Rhodotorula glutinis]
MSSSSSTRLIKSVALAGAGNLGAFFPEHLLAEGLETTVLTRAGSDKSFPAGVKVKEVDYSSTSSLESALEGIDAVIATLTAYDAQTELIKAAAAAGVKLFVPSEFGNVSTALKEGAHPALAGKGVAHGQIKEAGLPAVLVFTGPFPETTFAVPYFGANFVENKVTIYGEGKTQISWTTRRDIARFTAHHLSTLTSLPPVDSPTILRLEGSSASFLDVVSTFKRLHPARGLDVQHVPLAHVEKAAKDVEGGFLESLVAYLLLTWEQGYGKTDEAGEQELSKWDEWKPQTLEEVLKELTADLE